MFKFITHILQNKVTEKITSVSQRNFRLISCLTHWQLNNDWSMLSCRPSKGYFALKAVDGVECRVNKDPAEEKDHHHDKAIDHVQQGVFHAQIGKDAPQGPNSVEASMTRAAATMVLPSS